MRAARVLVETEELKTRPRQILRDLLAKFEQWRRRAAEISHEELAQLVLEESGYVDMWKAERTPDAAGRLDNLKELVRSMGEFPDLGAFLEHVSLVMDVEGPEDGPRVSIMTLHGAKGLEFDIVFLPGWEEGLFPHPRSLDDNGRAGLEEERRLAYVGLTRARREAKISFAANRRIRGLWQTSLSSRFIGELPEEHIEFGDLVVSPAFSESSGSRFDAFVGSTSSRYDTPGWRRAEQHSRNDRREGRDHGGPSPWSGRGLSSRREQPSADAPIEPGARVFHQKFGPGSVVHVDGPKLTVDFDKAGRKLVMESFVVAQD
jgi:DNA helicase-2/ATP-dependent DNA helicase PcrA